MDNKKNWTDQELLHAIRRSSEEEEAALSFLYQNHYKQFTTIGKRRLKDEEAAIDLFNECLLQIFRKKVITRTFPDEIPIVAYLQGIYNKLCLRHKDRFQRRKFKIIFKPLESSALFIEDTLDLFELVLKKEFEELLLKKVHALDTDCRFYLKKHYYEQLSSTQIAIQIGKKSGSVTTAIHRCRKKLETMIRADSELLNSIKADYGLQK